MKSALNDNDYVVLIKSNSDKREKKIAFTEKGKLYAKEVLTPLYELEQKVYSMMGHDKVQQLYEMSKLFNILFSSNLEETINKQKSYNDDSTGD